MTNKPFLCSGGRWRRSRASWISAVNLGLVLSELEQWPEALTVLEQARRHSPAVPELFNVLGRAQQGTGNLPAAIENFQQAVALRPAFPFALNNLGCAYSLTGRHSETIQTLEKARQMEACSPLILTNLGRALLLAGRKTAARDNFRAALALYPKIAEATLAWSRLLAESAQYDEALQICQQALHHQPAHLPLLLQESAVHRNLGQFAAAQAA